jgi:hypothetical protein
MALERPISLEQLRIAIQPFTEESVIEKHQRALDF